MSATQRSLAFLRSRGYHAAVVEKWNQFARVRQDAFGFVDIDAFRRWRTVDGERKYAPVFLKVQTTTQVNAPARCKKIEANEAAKDWLAIGGRIEVHGWAKQGKRGKRKTWVGRIRTAHLESGAIRWWVD